MARYKATFDESGSSTKGDFYAMAGILATRRQFKALYKAWRIELHKSPRIESFHMTDAASQEGQFEGWRKPKIKAKVEALTDVLRNVGIAYTIVLVPMWQFTRIMRISTTFPEHYYDPYLYCFVESVKAVWIAMTRDGMFQGCRCDLLIFDRGRSNDVKRTCRAILDMVHDGREASLKQIARTVPDDFSTSNAKDEIGIQAADLIAWHYRTLPWERQYKKHRRRKFIAQIAGLKVAGPVPVEDDLNNYRTSLYDVLQHEQDVRLKRQQEKSARAEEWKRLARAMRNPT